MHSQIQLETRKYILNIIIILVGFDFFVCVYQILLLKAVKSFKGEKLDLRRNKTDS